MSVSYGGDKITFDDGTSIASGLSHFRNRIINGDMRIDQRNAGASGTANDNYTVDRWEYFGSQASKGTWQQSTTVVPPGFTHSLSFTSSSAYTVGASESFQFTQHIEGYNAADLMWGTANAKTITLSFWVRSSLTGTFGGVINMPGNTRAYPFTYTISSGNTWEYKTVTIPGDTSGTWPTANGRGISLRFGLGVGSTYSAAANAWTGTSNIFGATGATSVVGTNNATWYITGVQLEQGSYATTFERRPFGTELQLCQRYYQKTYDLSVTPGTTYNFEYNAPATAVGTGNFGTPCGRPFLVPMRTSPSVTTYDGAGNSGKVSAWAVGNNQSYSALTVSQNQLLSFDFGYNTTSGRHYTFSYVASAEL